MNDARRFFEALDFRYEWRKYQRLVLDLFEQRDPAKRTFHVVAPPGSGKTLVGIEIARRLGTPAVTFSPTTTIQGQWRDKVELFIPEATNGARVEELLGCVSTDPSRLGAISSLTYQSLSTQTQEREFLDRLGRSAWLRELIEEGGRDDESANAYLAGIRERADHVYRGEVARRAIREKRRALASGEARLHDLLHPNVIDLIDRIVAAGTGCLLLDEAHHLLDYWAWILGDLIHGLAADVSRPGARPPQRVRDLRRGAGQPRPPDGRRVRAGYFTLTSRRARSYRCPLERRDSRLISQLTRLGRQSRRIRPQSPRG